MTSVKKMIKGAIGRRYGALEGKENRGYSGTPGPNSNLRTSSARRASESNVQMESEGSRHYLRRNTSATQSIRDAVGVFRQKLKKSTRQRKRLQTGMNSPAAVEKSKGKKTATRRGGYREVKMYSPFNIVSPKTDVSPPCRPQRQKWFDVETPGKLRKEVEDLTANMEALVSLTPNTLITRAASRRSLQAAAGTYITNGSLKAPQAGRKGRQARRRITHV